MSFSFNFQIGSNVSGSVGKAGPAPLEEDGKEGECEPHLVKAERVVYDEASDRVAQAFPVSDVEIFPRHFLRKTNFQPSKVPEEDRRWAQPELKSVLSDSDVRPAVYEGGFKLWECALDLISFLHHSGFHADGLSILDLGCGHGLPGIFCLNQSARHVAFQDFNADVLRYVTCRNLLLNTSLLPHQLLRGDEPSSGHVPLPPAQLVAGSWSDTKLWELLGEASYDVILSADTLYSVASMPHFLRVIKRLLRRPHPSLLSNSHHDHHCSSTPHDHHSSSTPFALVAAKRFYFGVGGSTLEFRKLVERDGEMMATVVKTLEDGVSNIREIIKLTWQ